jgi:soluble lytic murein transglycosylase-like protein
MTDAFEAKSFVSADADRSRSIAAVHARVACHQTRAWWRTLLAAMIFVGLANCAEVHASSPDVYQPVIIDAAHRFAIPAHWIRAVMVAESAADPQAVSPKGAMGLMQIMPDTWDNLRSRHGLGLDPFAPANNIMAGTAYLREMFDRYGSVALMLAAYNAGPGRVDDHLAIGRALPDETIAYVAELLPQLSAPHAGIALHVPTDQPADPSAATLFPQAGYDFYAGQDRLSAHSWPLGATVQPQASVPSASQGTTMNSPLFVQPNSQRTP